MVPSSLPSLARIAVLPARFGMTDDAPPPGQRATLGRIAIGAGGVVLAVGAFGVWGVPAAQAARWAGGLLGVAGVSLTTFGLAEKRALVLGRPGPRALVERALARAWALIRSVLRIGPRRGVGSTIHGGGHVTLGGLGVSARGSVRPAEDAELRRWIEYLDGQVKALREDLNALGKRHREDVDRLREERGDLERRLRASDQETEDLVEEALAGSFGLELLGAFWIAAGIALATWPRFFVGALPPGL